MTSVLERIVELFPEARKSGGSWSARCRAHDDRNASLSITEQTKTRGAVMVVCGAGCSYTAVLDAVGLVPADLYPDCTRTGSNAFVLREFDYCNADGEILFRVRRLDTSHGARNKFVMVHPTPDGWRSGAGTNERVLYRLPDIVRNPDAPIIVTEGERDADTLSKLGLVTTTVASGRWLGVDMSTFRDRGVILVADNDRRGFEKARKAADVVHAAGAGLVAVARPPNQYKDATAAITAGCAWSDFVQNVNLHLEAPPVETWEPEPVPKPDPFPARTDSGTTIWGKTPISVLTATGLSDLAVRIFGLLDVKAGNTREAKVTHAELAQALGRSTRSTAPIARSVQELIDLGIVEQMKRGWYLVHNAARATHSTRSPSLHKIPNIPAKSHGHANSGA